MRNIGEPAFADLLAAAGFVESDNEIRLFGDEIGGRIVESDVAIFADAQKCDVDGRRRQLFADLASHRERIGRIAGERVKVNDAGLRYQALHQKFAKTGGMRGRQADVFIEMESLNSGPIDAGRFGQCIQKLELRRAGCRDDAGATALGNSALDRYGSLVGGGTGWCNFIFEYSEQHRKNRSASGRSRFSSEAKDYTKGDTRQVRFKSFHHEGHEGSRREARRRKPS